MKFAYTVHVLLFLKKTNMCLPLPQRFEKIKNFFEFICRQLKYYQHGIRSKIGISLQIIQQHIHQKDLNLCLHHVTMRRLLLNWKKHKQEVQLCYGAYNETK